MFLTKCRPIESAFLSRVADDLLTPWYRYFAPRLNSTSRFVPACPTARIADDATPCMAGVLGSVFGAAFFFATCRELRGSVVRPATRALPALVELHDLDVVV